MLTAFVQHLRHELRDAATVGVSVVIGNAVFDGWAGVANAVATFILWTALAAVVLAAGWVVWDESEGRFD